MGDSGVVLICQEVHREKSEMDSQFLLQNMSAPVFGIDEDCKLTLWNPAIAELTRVKEVDVKGWCVLLGYIPHAVFPVCQEVSRCAANSPYWV